MRPTHYVKRGPRVRVEVKATETGGWYAVRVDAAGYELERTHEGSYIEAETARANYLRYGAWKKS